MRIIFHSDLNSFYATVEQMLDPSLRGKAIAVCGCTEERHGIVLAKSEQAKRMGQEVEAFEKSLSDEQRAYLADTAAVQKVVDLMKAEGKAVEKVEKAEDAE